MFCQKCIQSNILVSTIHIWLFQQPVGNLGIKDPVTVDFKLADQGAGVLTEIMKNFYDLAVFQNLFECSRELVKLQKIKNITVVF